ncbi:MAG: hypothetical protein ACN6RK_06345 [Stenotrophomonas sp.]|jgi:hypothetical protein
MRVSTYRFCTFFLAVVGLSGCQNEASAPTAGQHTPAGRDAASVTPAEVAAPNPKVDFFVTPDTIRECAGAAPITAEVKWEVRDPAVAEVKIEVGNTDGAPRKLLSQAGRQGGVSTDAWVVVGTKFFLSEFASGKELASVVIKGAPCN